MDLSANQRLKKIWNEWSNSLVDFIPIKENTYLVKTKLFNKHQKEIHFDLIFDEKGTYKLSYHHEKKQMEISNIKEENLPAEILRLALMIDYR